MRMTLQRELTQLDQRKVWEGGAGWVGGGGVGDIGGVEGVVVLQRQQPCLPL